MNINIIIIPGLGVGNGGRPCIHCADFIFTNTRKPAFFQVTWKIQLQSELSCIITRGKDNQ